MKTYADFEVWIGQATAAGPPAIFPIQVFSSPAGPAAGELRLDLDAEEFGNALAVASGEGAGLAKRQAFGGRLYAALFQGKVRDAWVVSRDKVQPGQPGQPDGLRLRLWINEPRLALLPWELLWDEDAGWLATASDLALSRYLPVPEPSRVPIPKPLRILIVVASPASLDPIEPAEIEGLEAAVKSLGANATHTLLRNPTVPQIQDALQKGQGYHVVHFLGHGYGGALALTTPDGKETKTIVDDQFAQLFQRRLGVRLVVLSVCHSSQAEPTGLFTGIGPALIRGGRAGRGRDAVSSSLHGHGGHVQRAVLRHAGERAAGGLRGQRGAAGPLGGRPAA